MIRVFGQITDASGKGVAGAMIELRALKSSTEVLYGSVFTYKCDASGHYEFPLAIGAYDAYAQNDICGDMDYLGTAMVTADTDDGGLHHIPRRRWYQYHSAHVGYGNGVCATS